MPTHQLVFMVKLKAFSYDLNLNIYTFHGLKIKLLIVVFFYKKKKSSVTFVNDVLFFPIFIFKIF